MAFLVVGGVTVDVAEGSADERVVEVGQRRRAVDGTMRSSVAVRKKVWSATTVEMTAAEKNSLISALEGTPPITCSGDFLGASTSCLAERGRLRPVSNGTTLMYVLSFKLFEE